MPTRSSHAVTRRDFIRLTALACCGGILAACTGNNRTPASADVHTYYTVRREEILDERRPWLSAFEEVWGSEHGSREAAALAAETEERFTVLLADLPYIGGKHNDLTENLLESALALALYRALQARRVSLAQTGRLLYRSLQVRLASMPMLGASGRAGFSETTLENLAATAAESQKRAFPDDWVYTYIPGDGVAFDYGVDYTECGICKYFSTQDASELTPYLCTLDFPISQVFNTGLERTTTLAEGGTRCDFRYKFGRPVRMS